MQRFVVVSYILVLCFLFSGIAQSQNHFFQRKVKSGFSRVVGKYTTAKSSLGKAAVVYALFPLMLCCGAVSCDKAERLPEKTDEASDIESAEQVDIEALAAEDGVWIVEDGSNDGDWSYGVYVRPHYALEDYTVLKIHDKTGRLLPESLRPSWSILYKNDGDVRIKSGNIESVDGESVVITAPFVAIDASQVLGVEILGDDSYEGRKVMFSADHALFLYSTYSPFSPKGDAKIGLHYFGKIDKHFTSGHAEVSLRQDLVYYMLEGHSEPIPFTFSALQEKYPDIKLLHRWAFVKKEHLTMVEDPIATED